MSTNLVVRSSPRIIAPDWRRRFKGTQGVIRLVLLLTLLFLVLRGGQLPGFVAALVLLVILGGGMIAAKALNARVVITPDYVESRDEFRRSRRCDRSILAAWVLGRHWTLKKVLLVDRNGRTQLSLAWDSYSESQFDQIRDALGLPYG